MTLKTLYSDGWCFLGNVLSLLYFEFNCNYIAEPKQSKINWNGIYQGSQSSSVVLCRLCWYTVWSTAREHKSLHVRGCKTVFTRCGFQILELAFGFPVVRGVPDSLSCIPDSKAQDSSLYKQNFPDSLTRSEQKIMFSRSLVGITGKYYKEHNFLKKHCSNRDNTNIVVNSKDKTKQKTFSCFVLFCF